VDPIDYYERYAGVYYDNTVDLEMNEVLDKFLVLLPENAEVLDLGCGSGRDSLYLEEQGCYVTLLDGSKEMCKLAEIHTDKEVLHMDYAEMNFEKVFDGIWACASLLHLSDKEIDGIMEKTLQALKPNGILYMSFKYGEAMEIRSGRLYHDYTEETAIALIERCELAELLEVWVSADNRGREQQWLNILVKAKEENE